ncbi:MAG: hypothetical protein HQM10_12340 [Candidatus Riflebacteria bacterium]|nr:hypothetical protein [Candidatus Riflebacteria bacterium]
MKTPILIILALLISVASFGSGEGSAESVALYTVKREISLILESESTLVKPLGEVSAFQSDIQKFLRRYPEVSKPKTILVDGKPAKILVPLVIDKNTVGGFFQVSPDGKTIISLPQWKPNGEPLFTAPAGTWQSALMGNDVPQIPELIPLLTDPTAGVPVEPEDITECYLIDFLDSIPSKTQEEKQDFAKEKGYQTHERRRYGSLKCLSYAAAISVDWWKIALNEKLGSYCSFMTGGQEYGTDPRVVESLYHAIPKSPYSFLKFNIKKDLVTKEKVPYSPKHFAYILSCIPIPATVPDALYKDVIHRIPGSSFSMDRPFFNVFDKSKGTIQQIKQALESFGILYSQHTPRRQNDSNPIGMIGVHSINIVGVGKLKGKEVVLYYETFGKNHRDYIEDGFFGPRLRAFPVDFFYQGLAFPHAIDMHLSVKDGKVSGNFVNFKKQHVSPDRLKVTLNGEDLPINVSSSFSLDLKNGVNHLNVKFRKKYFQTPEEPIEYERNYYIAGDKYIETRELENNSIALTNIKRKESLFHHKVDGYMDFLLQKDERLKKELLFKIQTSISSPELLKTVSNAVQKSEFLPDSIKRDLRSVVTDLSNKQ